MQVLKSALSALKENGFVISRESPSCEVRNDSYPNVTIVTVHRTPSETVVLLRRETQRRDARYIEINSSDDFSWLPEVQEALSTNQKRDLLLYSVHPTSGILGLTRCLKKEYTNGNIRCVFLMNGGEGFDPDSRTYYDHLEKNMTFNVYRNGEWGTFRHLPLEDSNVVGSENCFMNIKSRGDLSGIAWIEGALTHNTMPEPEKELVYVSNVL